MTKMRRIAAGAALLTAAASPVLAQPVNFTTTGRFTSARPACNNVSALMNATCSFDGFNLVFNGTSAVNIGSNTVASLGSFLLTGIDGNTTIPSGTVTFELFISQTTPSIGNTSFMGSVMGSVTIGVGGNVSSLVWLPTSQSRAIGNTRYELIYDNIGPAANRGFAVPVNNLRGISTTVITNVVPEPSTVVLLGTGFAVLFGMALRRKNV